MHRAAPLSPPTCSRCPKPRLKRGRYCAECRAEYMRDWRVREAERWCNKFNMALQAEGLLIRVRVGRDGMFHVKHAKTHTVDDA